MKNLANQLLQRLNLRLMRSSSVDALHQQASELALRAAELNGQIGDLRNKVIELDRNAAALGAENRSLREKLAESDARVEAADRLVAAKMAELRRQRTGRLLGFDDEASRPLIAIVMTTVSQIPQLKAFASAEGIGRGFDLAVIAYFDVRASSLLDFCTEREILVLDHNCRVVGDNADIESLLASEDTESAFFGASASFDGYDLEDKRLLEHTNRLLAEIHWQNGIALEAGRFLRRLLPSALVLFEDNAAYHTGIWVAMARRNDIPVVVFPYAIIDQGDAAEAHFNNSAHWAEAGIFNRFVRSALPQWVLTYRDRPLLRRAAVGALTSEALGFAQPRPWVWNSTKADVLAVESPAMRDIYVSAGIPDRQIEVTGSMSDDLLCRALANRCDIRRELGLDERRQTLVCGFPPNQLSVNRPDPEFHDFKTIVDRWLEQLSKLDDWQVILKPHPAMHADDIAYLQKSGFPVTTLDTTSLIAICDLFNTSVSSTIRWALACGKPTLNYDVYRYRYQDFVNEPAVVTVYEIEEFSRQLRRLTGDRAVLQEAAEFARAASARWGMLDGRSAERIATLMSRLVNRQ